MLWFVLAGELWLGWERFCAVRSGMAGKERLAWAWLVEAWIVGCDMERYGLTMFGMARLARYGAFSSGFVWLVSVRSGPAGYKRRYNYGLQMERCGAD